MSNSIQQANDFWFEYDDFFLWKAGQEILSKYQEAFQGMGLDVFYNSLAEHYRNGTFPQLLIQQFIDSKTSIDFIAEKQLLLLNKHFNNEPEEEMQAFIDFGQGILYDNRRANSRYRNYVIHTMDASSSTPPIGYHRWYGFIRAFALLNNIDSGRWLSIAHNVGLAWAVQSIAKPIGVTADGSNPNNLPLPEESIGKLKHVWLNKSFETLDSSFLNYPYPDTASMI